MRYLPRKAVPPSVEHHDMTLGGLLILGAAVAFCACFWALLFWALT